MNPERIEGDPEKARALIGSAYVCSAVELVGRIYSKDSSLRIVPCTDGSCYYCLNSVGNGLAGVRVIWNEGESTVRATICDVCYSTALDSGVGGDN